MKLLISTAILLLILSTPKAIKAENNNYILQVDNISINQYQKISQPSPSTEQKESVSQNIPKSIIETGSKNSNSKKPFTFSISKTLVDFGIISPTDPVTRLQTLTISKGIAQGYRVLASENYALKNIKNEEFIPDTSCDNGTCTSKIASFWENVLTYGFGFKTSFNSFKRFSNESQNEENEAIIQRLYSQEIETTEILYKINISGTQNPGLYENTVTMIAIPSF